MAEYESVKILASIVEKVRKDKKKTGVPIAKFFELAAIEKLESARDSKNPNNLAAK